MVLHSNEVIWVCGCIHKEQQISSTPHSTLGGIMWHGRRMLKVAIRSLLDSRLHGAPPNRAFHMTRGCCDIAQASGSAQKIRLPPHTGESIDYLSRLDRWRLVTGRIYLPCVRSTCCWSSLAPAIVDIYHRRGSFGMKVQHSAGPPQTKTTVAITCCIVTRVNV